MVVVHWLILQETYTFSLKASPGLNSSTNVDLTYELSDGLTCLLRTTPAQANARICGVNQSSRPDCSELNTSCYENITSSGSTKLKNLTSGADYFFAAVMSYNGVINCSQIVTVRTAVESSQDSSRVGECECF